MCTLQFQLRQPSVAATPVQCTLGSVYGPAPSSGCDTIFQDTYHRAPAFKQFSARSRFLNSVCLLLVSVSRPFLWKYVFRGSITSRSIVHAAVSSISSVDLHVSQFCFSSDNRRFAAVPCTLLRLLACFGLAPSSGCDTNFSGDIPPCSSVQVAVRAISSLEQCMFVACFRFGAVFWCDTFFEEASHREASSMPPSA